MAQLCIVHVVFDCFVHHTLVYVVGLNFFQRSFVALQRFAPLFETSRTDFRSFCTRWDILNHIIEQPLSTGLLCIYDYIARELGKGRRSSWSWHPCGMEQPSMACFPSDHQLVQLLETPHRTTRQEK